MSAIGNRPGIFQKYFFKVPVLLHKIGLGGWERLIGAQWMLITTTGRKTGKRRDAMVDVMESGKAPQTLTTLKRPTVHMQIGTRTCKAIRSLSAGRRRKFRARAGALTNEGAGEMLVKFYRERPAYTKSVMAMAGMKFKDEDELRVLGQKFNSFGSETEKE